MVHFGSTPERLLGRNDSKNPATTCRGITSSGRACRRALAASPQSRRPSRAGVAVVVEDAGEIEEAQYYCWQHKDQAQDALQEIKQDAARRRREGRVGYEAGIVPLQEKSSIDTLVQRLGIEAPPKKMHGIGRKPAHANEMVTGERPPGPPRHTATYDFANPAGRPYSAQRPAGYGTMPPSRSSPKVQSFWASLCCLAGSDEDDYLEIVRHRQRGHQRSRPPEMTRTRPTATTAHQPTPVWPAPAASIRPAPSAFAGRPQQRSWSNPRTAQLMSMIPKHLPPSTSAALIAELAKPISPSDEEGFIYIFWLTPQHNSVPPAETARSLLAPTDTRPGLARSISDVVTEYSQQGSAVENAYRGFDGRSAPRQKTIMLKIGRANNVTRRMHEWQRQCGYVLNLVRWYPQLPSGSGRRPAAAAAAASSAATATASAAAPGPMSERACMAGSLDVPGNARSEPSLVRKVPCVKRVERLVHIELGERQVRQRCGVCMREHREWFEVDASQDGVRAVDECIRRWVKWGLDAGS